MLSTITNLLLFLLYYISFALNFNSIARPSSFFFCKVYKKMLGTEINNNKKEEKVIKLVVTEHERYERIFIGNKNK